MKLVFNILGVILVLLGLFFVLEGAKVISVVALAHFTRYLLGGIVVIVIGIVSFVVANRGPKSAPPTPPTPPTPPAP